MRTLGSLASLVASATIEGLARACVVTRRDGTIIRFAEVNSATVFNGDTFEPGVGVAIGSIAWALNEGPGRVDFDVVAVEGGVIDFTDLQDGLFGGAEVELFLIDRLTPANAPISLFFGDMGQITYTDQGHATFQVIGPLARSQNYTNEVYSGSCRAFFTDARCTIDAATVTFVGAVVVSTTGRMLTVSGPAAATANWRLGLVTFSSGQLAGRAREIRNSTLNLDGTTTLELYVGFGVAPQAGDVCDVRQGCSFDLDPDTGCLRYSNILNFRGEPWIDPAPTGKAWDAFQAPENIGA